MQLPHGPKRTSFHTSVRWAACVGTAIACHLTATTALEAQRLTLVRADDVIPPLNLVDGRDVDMIRDDLSGATELGFRLEAQIDELEDLLTEAKAKVEVKKSEIEIIDTERKLADSQGRDVEKKALEREKEYEEALKRVLERTAQLREREIDLAKSRRDGTRSAVRVHERELALVRSSGEFAALEGTGSGTLDRAMRLEREVTEREKDLLEGLRDHARRKQDEADKERRVYEAKLDIIDARKQLSEIEG